jgi:hypothetical protein
MGYGMASPTGQSQRGNPTGTFKEKRPHGYQKYAMQNFTPEMMDKFMEWMRFNDPDSDLYKMAQGDQSYYDQLEAPALKQFSALQGNIASRFSGAGMGARNSSGFQNTLGQAGSDFAEKLQAQRLGLQRQAQQDLFSNYNNLLNQKPYDQGYVEKKPRQSSGWGALIGGGVGAAAGAYFGGPQGAATGANVGYNLFSGL